MTRLREFLVPALIIAAGFALHAVTIAAFQH